MGARALLHFDVASRLDVNENIKYSSVIGFGDAAIRKMGRVNINSDRRYLLRHPIVSILEDDDTIEKRRP